MVPRALCITISDDRGDESFADDLNMGRGIVSGRVALLLRSTEIPPHRPNDLLPTPPFLPTPTGQGPFPAFPRLSTLVNTCAFSPHPMGLPTNRDWDCATNRDKDCQQGLGTGRE